MSQRLPALKPREVLRILERAGFAVHHVSGSPLRAEAFAENPSTGHDSMANKDLRIGTLRSIIDQEGFTVSELVELI